jgi:hypothetical protein
MENNITLTSEPIKDDIDLKELSELMKITNSVPLAVALFIAIIFYKKYDGFKHCNCNDYTRKIEDKTIYLEIKVKDLQSQIDDLRNDPS